MQLDQILIAAVAAGNVDEIDVDELPSPDVPATSPHAPRSSSSRAYDVSQQSPSSNQSSPKVSSEDASLSTVTDFPDSSGVSVSKDFPKTSLETSNSGSMCEGLSECLPLGVVSDDFSLFNLREDSLVITSQQALAMFESGQDDSSITSFNSARIKEKNPVKCQTKGTAVPRKPENLPQPLKSVDEDQSETLNGDVPAACGEVEIETSTLSPAHESGSKVVKNGFHTNAIDHDDKFEVPNLEVPNLEFPNPTSPSCLLCDKHNDSDLDDLESLPDITVSSSTTAKKEKLESHSSNDSLKNSAQAEESSQKNYDPDVSEYPSMPNIVVVSKKEAFGPQNIEKHVDTSNATFSISDTVFKPSENVDDEPISQILSQTINEVLNGTSNTNECSNTDAVDNFTECLNQNSLVSSNDDNTVTLHSVKDVHFCSADEPEYTSLMPVCSSSNDNPLLEDNLSSITGMEPPAGATVDATLDENGQFLVQVIAPGLNMSIPNQFLNKVKPNSNITEEHGEAIDSLTDFTAAVSDFSKTSCHSRTNKPGRKRRNSSVECTETLESLTKMIKNEEYNFSMKLTNNISIRTSESVMKRVDKRFKKKKKKKMKYLQKMMAMGKIPDSDASKYYHQSQFQRYHQNANEASTSMNPYAPYNCFNYPQFGNMDTTADYYRQAAYASRHKSAFAPPVPGNNNHYFMQDGNPQWSMEEMLNSPLPPPHPTSFKEFQSGFYDCHNNYGGESIYPDAPVPEEEDDGEQMPIIMSPEEYHGKLQRDGQVPGSIGSAELVQTNTDGESLKVQLVYLVYPNKNKQNPDGKTSILPS